MDISNIWKNVEEETIHECLEEAYLNRHYKTVNYHKSDRSHEKGIDIKCENENEKIHIQVKIKPIKTDIDQLKKLSKSKCNKRIYVSIQSPAVSFETEAHKISNIEFWDKEKLHDFLIENNSNTYIRIIFLSFPVVRKIIEILNKIILSQKKLPEPLGEKQLPLWWLFKDRTVKLHAHFQFIKKSCERDLLSKDVENLFDIKKSMEQMYSMLKIVDEEAGEDIIAIVKKINNKCPQILSKYMEKASNRSNWMSIPSIENSNKDIHIMIERWVVPKPDKIMSFYNQINFYMDNLEQITEAIEDGVDWVFHDKFNNES